jgi:hypothetical protein
VGSGRPLRRVLPGKPSHRVGFKPSSLTTSSAKLAACRARTSGGVPEFTTEHVGGTAVGKNILLSDDGSEVAAVIDATTWNEHEQPEVKLLNMLMVGHELSHPWIERGRMAAGVYDGVAFPSVTSGEIARSMSLILAGEYRADYLSDEIPRAVFPSFRGTRRRPCGTPRSARYHSHRR